MVVGKKSFQKRESWWWLFGACALLLLAYPAEAKVGNCFLLQQGNRCKGGVVKKCKKKRVPKKVRVPSREFRAKCYLRLMSLCLDQIVKAYRTCKRSYPEKFCAAVSRKARDLCSNEKMIFHRVKRERMYQRAYQKRCYNELYNLMDVKTVYVNVKGVRMCKKKIVWPFKHHRNIKKYIENKTLSGCRCGFKCTTCKYKKP